MANANSPRGLVPYAYMSGAPYNGAVRTYYVPSGNGTALYIGDPVDIVQNNSDGNGVPVAEIATAGSTHAILGAFMGISNNAGQFTIPLLQSQPVYLPAGQAAYIYVCDDPFLLYWVQENSIGGGGTSGAMVSGASGGNTNLIAGAGSTYSGYSGWQLDSSLLSQAGSDGTLQIRIIQALQEPDNAIGPYCKWMVKINQGLSSFTSAVTNA